MGYSYRINKKYAFVYLQNTMHLHVNSSLNIIIKASISIKLLKFAVIADFVQTSKTLSSKLFILRLFMCVTLIEVICD